MEACSGRAVSPGSVAFPLTAVLLFSLHFKVRDVGDTDKLSSRGIYDPELIFSPE